MKHSITASYGENLQGKEKIWLIFVLGALSAFGPLSMDMYLPALPTMTADFQTTASMAQLSITSCLIGLAVGQIYFGPLSDRVGRKTPLLFTLSIYIFASLLCAVSLNIWMFIGLRFVQGLAGSAGMVISRAAARDLYQGKALTKFIALLALVNGVAPILAPISGGVILNWATWHLVFYVLAAIGVFMLVVITFTFKETLPQHKLQTGCAWETVLTFKKLFLDKKFMGIALTAALISMGMFAYIAGSPFVLQEIYGLSAQQFSIVFAMNGLGIILAAQLTGRLVGYFEEIQLLAIGTWMSLIGALLLTLTVGFQGGVWLILIALFLIVSSVGIVNTTSFSLAMQTQGHIAGSASAFLGILPFGGGGLVSPLVGIAGEATAIPMALTILLCSTLSMFCLKVMVRKNLNQQVIPLK